MRTSSSAKPTKLLSKRVLKRCWNKSRDSTSQAGRPGIDGVTAQRFAANLDHNLNKLVKALRSGSYTPTGLKAVFVPKPDSSKERMICIPSVIDRLVQKTIVEYLVSNRKLPIYNSSSFGFIRGLGTGAAIDAVIKYRSEFEWCLKTDVETFFDSISRPLIKARIAQALGKHSLVPIITRVADCDIKLTPNNRWKIRQQGLKMGVGLRQGMPLSPILANLVLSKFDQEIERSGIRMVRYADDLMLFFPNKEEAIAGLEFVKVTLKKVELTIPEISDTSKTKLIPPREPVDFLGREIVYLGSQGKYVARVSAKQIGKIKKQLCEHNSLANRLKLKSTLEETVVEMWRSVASYRGIYKDAQNFADLDNVLRQSARTVISQIFKEIFGEHALSGLSKDQLSFLGLGQLIVPEGVNDLEQ